MRATAGASDTAVPPGSWKLWFGLLGGHVAWTVQLVTGYYAAALVCHLAQAAYWALHYGATLAALAATAAAGAVSYREWRRLDGSEGGGAEESGGRSALMAALGALLSAIYLLVIALTGVSPLIVRPCR